MSYDPHNGLSLGQRVRISETRPNGKTRTATGVIVKFNVTTFRVRNASGEEFTAAYPRHGAREMERTPGYRFEVEVL